MPVNVISFSAYGGTRLAVLEEVSGVLAVKHQMAVVFVEEEMKVYPICSMNHLNRPDHHPLNITENKGVSYTLTKQHHHAVAIVENVEDSMEQLTLLSEEVPASHSASQDSERDWMTLAATSHLHTLQLLINIAPNGSFGKMSPVSCHPTEEGILVASSGRWMKSGMGMRGVCWTLNMSEHPTIRGLSLKDEGVSSLSEILEVQVVPQRFYLTPKACLGILRRAEKRGKELPDLLRRALEATVRELEHFEQKEAILGEEAKL